MTDTTLTPEEQAFEDALALIAAKRAEDMQVVSDAMGAVGVAIAGLDKRLYPGGFNGTVKQLEMSVESIRAALKREYGTTYVSKTPGL